MQQVFGAVSSLSSSNCFHGFVVSSFSSLTSFSGGHKLFQSCSPVLG